MWDTKTVSKLINSFCAINANVSLNRNRCGSLFLSTSFGIHVVLIPPEYIIQMRKHRYTIKPSWSWVQILIREIWCWRLRSFGTAGQECTPCHSRYQSSVVCGQKSSITSFREARIYSGDAKTGLAPDQQCPPFRAQEMQWSVGFLIANLH